MKRLIISKLFLYRYRFYIGFVLLGVAYLGLLFLLPLLSPAGLSEAEMVSAAHSYALEPASLLNGDVVNLPYRALQKLSIMIFGLNMYSVKLPSIIIGAFLGLLLILLLNRWFKSNVALLASIMTVLASTFLYLSGTGTPQIMLVFWPTLLLWLGSKIQGVTKPKPSYCFLFAFALLASIFTPHLLYLAAFIVIFAIIHPHLRFTIKTLPTVPLILTIFIILLGLSSMVIAAIVTPEIIAELLWAPNITLASFGNNIITAFTPLVSWSSTLESSMLSPMIGLAPIALAVIGLLSTAKGFLASRNSIASWLIVFTVFLSGLTPDSVVLILLPFAILIAHGLRYILDKWYGLFPDNPYARISAVFPISIFIGIIIITGISHYIFGYRYIPMVADEFNNDIALIHQNVAHGTTIYIPEDEAAYNFYKILELNDGLYTVTQEMPEQTAESVATLGNLHLERELSTIITSPKLDNSDRIYIYSNHSVENTAE